MKINSDAFEAFSKELKKVNRVLIAGHENPDGDSTGSSIALYNILKKMGKEVVLYSCDPYPFNFCFLEGSSQVVNTLPEKEPDMYIILDAGAPSRVGSKLFSRLEDSEKIKVLFDHHPSYTDYSYFYNYIFSDHTAASTAVIIYRFIISEQFELDKATAVALYAATMSDTGGLRYNSANAEAFEVLSKLVPFVEPWEVASEIWENVPLNQLKMLSEVLNEMQIIADGRAAVIEIRQEQFDRYNLSADHVDSFVNFARSVRGVELAMRFRELEKNRYKVSMRSRGLIDASKVSHEFGGGGHKNAAGFVFEGTYEDGLKLVEEIVHRVS